MFVLYTRREKGERPKLPAVDVGGHLGKTVRTPLADVTLFQLHTDHLGHMPLSPQPRQTTSVSTILSYMHAAHSLYSSATMPCQFHGRCLESWKCNFAQNFAHWLSSMNATPILALQQQPNYIPYLRIPLCTKYPQLDWLQP